MKNKPLVTDNADGSAILDDPILDIISEKYSIPRDELARFIASRQSQKTGGVPITIISDSSLSGLEAIVKYLRENKNNSYEQIGRLLCRNPKTLAVSYAIARRKKPEKFSEDAQYSIPQIPFNAFNSGLSILESIAMHLHLSGYSYADIARMLGKSPKTIWTVCNRAAKKQQKSHAQNQDSNQQGDNGNRI